MNQPISLAAEKITAEWRRQRDAPLESCQASFTDRECIHKKCPVPRGDEQCPLPWIRYLSDL